MPSNHPGNTAPRSGAKPVVIHQSQGTLLTPRSSPLSASGGMLSKAAASVNLKAPTINAPRLQSGTVTPVQNRDIVGPTVAQVGNQLGKAAILYADRKATVEAQEANSLFQEATRNLWLGRETKDGFVKGYAATTAKDAVNGHVPFQEGLLQARNDIAEGLNDQARSKFLATSNASYQGVLNSAAQHAAGGMQQYEKQQLGVQQQTFYQTLDDLLLVESPEQIDNMMADHLQNLSNNYHVTPDKLPAVQQEMFKSMGAFSASQSNGSAKLNRLIDHFGSEFDIETATFYNQQLQTITAKENREMDRQLARQDRALKESRQANDLSLFANVTKGNEVDWDKQLQLAEAGQLSSSVFISQQDRYQSRDYLPPMPPDAEINVKNQILDGTLSNEDILTLPYDDSSVRRMGNFAISTQDHKHRNNLQYGYRRIDESLKSANMGLTGSERALMTTQAQTDYEKILKDQKTLTPQQAINVVLQSYIQDFRATTSPMVVLPHNEVLDLTSMDAALAIQIVDTTPGLSGSQISEYYTAIRRYYQSQSQDKSTVKVQ